MVDDLVAVAVLEIDEMAKAKAKPPAEDDTPKTLFSIKGRPSWHAWLKEFAETLDRDAIGAIDESLREHAKTKGFRKMPKRIG